MYIYTYKFTTDPQSGDTRAQEALLAPLLIKFVKFNYCQ